jgi:hypothetical protein
MTVSPSFRELWDRPKSSMKSCAIRPRRWTIGSRYEDIARAFNSIRDDAKMMVDQLADGKIDFMERVANIWMKMSRGDIADRFDEIRSTYLTVTKSTKDQIEREAKILDAYHDFRGALKQAEILALEVLKKSRGEARRRKNRSR